MRSKVIVSFACICILWSVFGWSNLSQEYGGVFTTLYYTSFGLAISLLIYQLSLSFTGKFKVFIDFMVGFSIGYTINQAFYDGYFSMLDFAIYAISIATYFISPKLYHKWK